MSEDEIIGGIVGEFQAYNLSLVDDSRRVQSAKTTYISHSFATRLIISWQWPCRELLLSTAFNEMCDVVKGETVFLAKPCPQINNKEVG
jgi:hypothetical protein